MAKARPTRKPGARGRWLVLAGVAVMVAVALAVAAGRAGHRAAPTAAGSGGVRVDRPGGVRVGDLAAALRVTTTAAGQFRLPAGKPAVLLFMAAWCNPVVEASALQRIDQDLAGRVAILGVDVDPTEPLAALQGFTDRVGVHYGFVQDHDGALAGALGVRAVDTTVVVDGAGRIVYRDAVPTSEATLRAALRSAGVTA
jgi:peroxiredoxin